MTDLFLILAPGLVAAVASAFAFVWVWEFAKRVIR